MTLRSLRLLIFSFCLILLRAEDEKSAPNYWGCLDEVARAKPYCDASLSIDERVQDLLSQLTLAEKVMLISPDPSKNTCACHTKSIPRIGFPDYMWLVETNTAVASACISPGKCATQFSGPLSMGASFNRTSWYLKGSVLGTEQRAFVNLRWMRFNNRSSDYIGLTAFGPNINQPRDPRFGRTSELPGEDPFLTGQYASQMVRGMQEPDAQGHPKVLAYLKHFTAYSRETNRGHDDYNITLHDLFDTYLPAYEMAMNEATGVMCSYNAINGAPSCANSWLLNEVLRKRWNRPLAHVVTDCGAIDLLLGAPAYAVDNKTAAAWALMNGTDVEFGSIVWTEYLVAAVEEGLATEAAVDQAFIRSYNPQFLAGRFDDPTSIEWSRYGLGDIQSPLHRQIQLEAALQGLVLLKNENRLIPVQSGSKIAVIGPLGQTRAGLMSDYEADQSCFGGTHYCIPTIAESIHAVNGPLTSTAIGVDVDSQNTSGIPAAVKLAVEADVIILCLGITKDQEHEGVDRIDTALPGQQALLAETILALGKPVVLVLVNGGQVAIDNLVDGFDTIVEAFNPNSVGGKAVALSLFGVENRWGKLPYTIYPYEVMQAFDMKDYSMSKPPGRTHRYFTGDAIFQFGYGLSCTIFEIACYDMGLDDDVMGFDCEIGNTGNVVGDEVLQVYHTVSDDIRRNAKHPVPLKSLIGFDRARLQPAQFERIKFRFNESIFAVVNENGDKVVYPGTHTILFTNGVMDPIEFHKVVPSGILSDSTSASRAV
jgi:beta-D-xylosidase 4